jgi:hypothetical protein
MFGSEALSETLSGGCQCGAVRYEVSQPPIALFVCHCRECQRQSASAFGVSVIVPSAALRLVRGVPRKWPRSTDSGRVLDCYFCPDCGSRVWHGDKDRKPTVSVKGGSLDTPPDLSRAEHIWTSRKLAGVTIPSGARQSLGEPV